MVEYKDIPGFHGYKVNKKGVVISTRKFKEGIVLAPKKDNKGYWYYKLTMENKRTYIYAARLVYSIFNNIKLSDNEIIKFLDGNKNNLRLENLVLAKRF